MPGIPVLITDNNGEENEATDTEDIGDDSVNAIKSSLKVESAADEGITDTEDMNYSEDDIDGTDAVDNGDSSAFLPDTKNEVINETEGYIGNSVTLESDDENDMDNVYSRHIRNLKKTEDVLTTTENDECAQIPTDTEDMNDSDECISPAEEATEETVFPQEYLEDNNKVTNSEVIRPIDIAKKRNKTKKLLKNADLNRKTSEDENCLTDVEDVGDTSAQSNVVTTAGTKRNISELKVRKRRTKKAPRKNDLAKNSQIGKKSSNDTDSECLVEENSESEEDEYDNRYVNYETDNENCCMSADELEEFESTPIVKEIPFQIPTTDYEAMIVNECDVHKSDVEDVDTDEGELCIDEAEDSTPLPKINPEDYITQDSVDSAHMDDADEVVDTEDDDIDVDESDKRELLNEIQSWKNAEESDILEKLDCSSGTESKVGKWKEAVVNIMKTSCTINSLKSMLLESKGYEDMDETNSIPTDEENLNEPELEESMEVTDDPAKVDNGIDTGSEDISDDEGDELIGSDHADTVQSSQLSELCFIETEKGQQLNIILTPEVLNDTSKPDMVDSVPGVVFLADNDDGNNTDVEDIEDPNKVCILINNEEHTDTEDFVEENSEMHRPDTPIPHEVEFSVLSSPKKERILIKEDKYGVPQVEIQKMSDDFLTVDNNEERPSTATEDVEITLEEALRIFGINESGNEECEIDAHNGEINEKLRSKIAKKYSPVSPSEDQLTDEEEVVIHKKKKRSKNAVRITTNLTDTEVLSGNEDKNVNYYTPVISTDEDTNDEDFEVSAFEDIIEEPKYLPYTPEGIRKVAVKRTEIYREGPDKTTGNVIIEPAQERVPYSEGALMSTDTEDMEGSFHDEAVEMDVSSSGPALSNDVGPTNVNLTEDFLGGRFTEEDLAIRTHLMYGPRIDAHTDVESLDGIEDNRNN